jgi:hypothetical protein
MWSSWKNKKKWTKNEFFKRKCESGLLQDASTKQAVTLQEKNDQVSEVQRFEWKRKIVLGLDYHIFLQELNPN